MELASAQGRQLRGFDLVAMREIAKQRGGEKARRALGRLTRGARPRALADTPPEPRDGL